MPDAEVKSSLAFEKLEVWHVMAIAPQASQQTVLGMEATVSPELAQYKASQRIAWAAVDGERVLACMGICEAFPGRQGLAWAILAEGIGSDHLTLTRFVRARIAESRLPRIEAIVKCIDVEPIAALFPQLGSHGLLRVALEQPTPEMRWAKAVGLKPAHVLRRYGAASESCMLFERIA